MVPRSRRGVHTAPATRTDFNEELRRRITYRTGPRLRYAEPNPRVGTANTDRALSRSNAAHSPPRLVARAAPPSLVFRRDCLGPDPASVRARHFRPSPGPAGRGAGPRDEPPARPPASPTPTSESAACRRAWAVRACPCDRSARHSHRPGAPRAARTTRGTARRPRTYQLGSRLRRRNTIFFWAVRVSGGAFSRADLAPTRTACGCARDRPTRAEAQPPITRCAIMAPA